ncbi:hypothetical protein [Caminibacter sp.]
MDLLKLIYKINEKSFEKWKSNYSKDEGIRIFFETLDNLENKKVKTKIKKDFSNLLGLKKSVRNFMYFYQLMPSKNLMTKYINLLSHQIQTEIYNNLLEFAKLNNIKIK